MSNARSTRPVFSMTIGTMFRGVYMSAMDACLLENAGPENYDCAASVDDSAEVSATSTSDVVAVDDSVATLASAGAVDAAVGSAGAASVEGASTAGSGCWAISA